MPTYEYACTACDHRFEKVQSFTDASLTECPECSGRLRKLYGSVGVVFKGPGFYRTDSRVKSSTADKGDKAPAAKEKTSSASNGDKSSSAASTTSTTTPTAKAS